MVVKIRARYNDTELGRETRMGEVLAVSDERGEMLIRRKVAKKISDNADVSKLPAPKKAQKKPEAKTGEE